MTLEAYYPGLTDDVQDSLVSHYEFENDVTDSAGSNDGTDNTSAGFVNGIRGEAKDFDGTDDYVEATGVSFDYAGDSGGLTVSAWAKPDTSANGIRRIVRQNVDSNNNYGVSGDFDVNEWLFESSNSSFAGGTIDVDRWQHLCLVLGGTDIGKAYENGVLIGTFSIADSSGTTAFTVGANKGGGGNFFPGAIDDVRLYSKALSPAEVRQLYNWGRAFDSSDNNNNADVRGATASSGVLGETAFSFDGTDDYVTAGEPPYLKASSLGSNFSLCAWVKANTAEEAFIVGKHSSSNNDNYRLMMFDSDSDSTFEWNVYVQADSSTFVGLTDVETDVWTHLSLTYNGSFLRGYVNGVEKGSTSLTGNLTDASGSPFTIGSQGEGDGEFFDGQVSDVRVYSRVLSPSEISYLYEVGQQGSIRFGGKVL